jgi:hypothetical protein
MKRVILKHKHDLFAKPMAYHVDVDTGTYLVVFKGKQEKMTLTRQPDNSYKNEHGVEYVKVFQDRRPKPYAINCREEGRGPANITKFATIVEVQAYVKSCWQGAEYIDSPTSFHSDYCRYFLKNCSLGDLGRRGSAQADSEEYFDWIWEAL